MKKTLKLLASTLTVLNLLCLTVIPAFAYTTYGTTYYSTKYGSYGTYSTRQIYYYTTPRTTQPTTTNPAPAPAPAPKPAPVPTTPTAPAPQPSGSTSLSAEESKMVNLVNQERIGQGIKPLSVNQQLTSLARLKS
ncbi:MAG TPA: hypothetical protein VEC37_12880, partial [Bacillota bacterium]|nr:hypothetical protein [Bacillota bacterium]